MLMLWINGLDEFIGCIRGTCGVYSMLLRLSSAIKVQIKYCFLRGDTLYWQRRVPKDLEDRYSGGKKIPQDQSKYQRSQQSSPKG